MSGLAEPVRTRLLPALLTAIGVTLLAAGALSVTTPVTADAQATPTPAASGLSGPTGSVPVISIPPLGSGEPSASPSIPPDRVATRVRIAALRIDLPVILQETRKVPCDVAMYFDDPNLGQPGEGRATYLYAHARKDMFLPLLDASKVKNGKKLLGMIVEVWTSDDQRFLYEITEVRRHVQFDDAFVEPISVKTEQLWLQTSEGRGTQPKLQLVALPLSQEAAEHADAHPVAKPRNCQPR
jgi:hypothetical protein